MHQEIATALNSEPIPVTTIRSDQNLPSVYDVSGLASATIGAAANEVAALLTDHGFTRPQVAVDRALASMWFKFTIDPVDFELPAIWDAVAGDYRCADGWIRLHTNAPHHRDAAMRVLGTPVDREQVAAEVLKRNGAELEAAIVAEKGCAAEMRTVADWRQHPQGRAVAAEPLIAWSGPAASWAPTRIDPERPLAGLKVLDLTRVLAGPTCTRFLAGWGADVLRIDPLDWDEDVVAMEVTLGKRCARLDLRSDPEVFDALLAEAHVVVHGYRPGAIDALPLAPFNGKVDVALDAYGWSGPWADRRGFDSLVQMSSGIAAEGMARHHTDKPAPLPAQALDHGTGYLMAAAVVKALRGGPGRARLSLARTAALLVDHPGERDGSCTVDGAATTDELTKWGTLRRLEPPVTIGDVLMHWDLPACPLGSHPPKW